MTRDELISLCYERIKDRLECCLVDFSRQMAEWAFVPVMRAGELCGVVICKDADFHIVALKPGRWASRKLFADTLGEAIKRYGYAQTAVMKDHVSGHQLALRLGFYPVKEVGNAVIYRLCEVKHA